MPGGMWPCMFQFSSTHLNGMSSRWLTASGSGITNSWVWAHSVAWSMSRRRRIACRSSGDDRTARAAGSPARRRRSRCRPLSVHLCAGTSAKLTTSPLPTCARQPRPRSRRGSGGAAARDRHEQGERRRQRTRHGPSQHENTVHLALLSGDAHCRCPIVVQMAAAARPQSVSPRYGDPIERRA